MSTDDGTDVRWMTYDEMAEALGITPDSARRLVARRKWPRRAGNDGRARIGVPAERIPDSPPDTLPDVNQDDSQDDPPDSRDDITPVLKVLTQHIERIEKELESVKSERDAEMARVAQLALQAAQVDALKVMIEVKKQQTEEAQQRVEEIQKRADERVEELKAERDKWASALEASQRQVMHLTEKQTERRSGWWPFRKSA
jgi:DNA repair exonuclease SbcCD ATPase subunit